MIEKRVYDQNNKNIDSGPVLLRLSRDLRINWNYALNYAINAANKNNEALILLLSLEDYFLVTKRRFDFFIEGFEQFKNELKKLNISLLIARNKEDILKFIDKLEPSIIITDFYPLKNIKSINKEIADKAKCKVLEIDSHNIVPTRFVSNKEEFAAYTIRPKIKKHINDFLIEIPEPQTVKQSIEASKFQAEREQEQIFEDTEKNIEYPNIKSSIFKGGEKAALEIFEKFKSQKFNGYSELRNDPSNEHLSDISPYFNFGFLSTQYVAYNIIKEFEKNDDRSTFLEEMIIRREISDNFCLYNENYDNFNGFRDWAKKTLNEHREDKREYIYSYDEFEKAKTHDKYWNAAQIQLVKEGKMHGYMRMYWAKKILEWSESPEKAQEIALQLNDLYEIDGFDPNGYVGVAWSIGGIHDRAWQEREVYGKIRYMNANGLKRKFDIEKYTNKYLKENGSLF